MIRHQRSDMVRMRRLLQIKKYLKFRKIFAGFFTFFCAFHLRAQESSIYFTQNGDTLSEILHRKNLRPLYGKHGSLEAALKLNPTLAARGGDHIRPHQQIYLPEFQAVSENTNLSSAPPPRKQASETEAKTDQPQKISLQENTEEKLAGDFYLGAEFAFNRLEASDASTGGQAEINSKSAYGLLIGRRTYWNEVLNSYVQISSQFIEYQPSDSALKVIDNHSVTRTHLEIGLEQTLSDKAKALYSLRYGQELFIRGMNSSLLHIDDVALVSIGGGFKYKLFEKADTYLSSDFHGQYILGGSTGTYTVNPGYFLSAALSLHQGPHLQTSVGVRERKQDTSLVNQTEQEVFGQMQFVWPFGGDRK
jgi:hypothetical protein